MAVYAPGRTSVLNVVAGWQGGTTVQPISGGQYGAHSGSAVPAAIYITSLGGGRFAIDSTPTALYRLRYQGSRVFLDSV